MTFPIDPERDLILERLLPVPVHAVWEAYTNPDRLMPWFCPLPWRTVACEIDLRPGGRFVTTMQSPEGELFPNAGCYLEVVPHQRLVFTSVLGEGFRPVVPTNGADDMAFTAVIEFRSAANERTEFRATAIHADAATAQKHREMGFHDGWGATLDQMVRMIEGKPIAG